MASDYKYPVSAVTAREWSGAVDWYNTLVDDRQWIFRGEASETPRIIKSKLERDFERLDVHREHWGAHELRLLKEFKRRTPLYQLGTSMPGDSDVLGWLALLRHYGGPTRLVDWTYSFYVAAFFALSGGGAKGTVWAVDAKRLRNHTLGKVPLVGGKQYDRVDHEVAVRLVNAPHACAYPANALLLNDRSAIQQGLYLMPGDIKKTFEDNLLAAFPSGARGSGISIVRMEFDTETRKAALRDLLRMNMTSATLFPDLQGFAESLSLHRILLWEGPPGKARVKDVLDPSGRILETYTTATK